MTNLPANADSDQLRNAPAKRTLSQQIDDLVAKFRAMPVRQRWLLAAVAVALGYYAVDTLCWQPARDWAHESEQIEAALARGAARGAGASRDLRRNVETFGAVEAPGDAATGRQELAQAIADVAKKHHFLFSYESRIGQRIKGSETEVLGGSIDRLQAEVKFETSPEELPRILDEIEMHPMIEGISALRLQKNEAARKITVQATIDAWVLGSGARRGS